MRFEQLFSGSSGNLYQVQAATGERLLLDPGVPWKKLQAAISYDLTGIVGCLVTHEHKDHCKAVKEVMAAGIDVWATGGTWSALGVKWTHRTKALPVYNGPPGLDEIMRPFRVSAFMAHHDAECPVILDIGCGGERLLFAPDTSHITQRFMIPFDIISIECSYDKAILQDRVDRQDIDESLAKRLLTSHMEKSVCMKYLQTCCDLSRCREIHLLHLSNDNIGNKETVRKEFEDELMIKTIIVGKPKWARN